MVDLSQIAPEDRTIEVLHPSTKQPIGLRWSLMSIDDERLIKAKRALTDERQRLAQRGKFFKAEELEGNQVNLLVKASTGWEWYNPTGKPGDKDYDAEAMASFNGEQPDFTPRNVRDVLSAPKMVWLYDQISEAVGETDAFFKNSKPI